MGQELFKGSAMLTLITCTGDRPICFSLLEGWISNQTVQPDQWVVVDDGQVETNVKSNCDYVRRMPQKTDPKFTLLLNIGEAFKHVKGDKVLFIEDDEYYAPDYIKEISEKLDRYDLVGIGRSKYYHLPVMRWYKHKNMGHASLAQTGFTANFFSAARSCLNGDMFFDVRFWRTVNGREADQLSLPNSIHQHESKDRRGFIFDDVEKSLYVGMKGMPGRKGIGIGHKEASFHNLDRGMLKSWISVEDDYNKYLKIKEELS